jgi:hypothetical protein
MRIAVTSPGAVAVFKAVAKGVEMVEATVVQLVENPMDAGVAEALEYCDTVVFTAGRATYRLAEGLSGLGFTRRYAVWWLV